jgi:hypothetical protein
LRLNISAFQCVPTVRSMSLMIPRPLPMAGSRWTFAVMGKENHFWWAKPNVTDSCFLHQWPFLAHTRILDELVVRQVTEIDRAIFEDRRVSGFGWHVGRKQQKIWSVANLVTLLRDWNRFSWPISKIMKEFGEAGNIPKKKVDKRLTRTKKMCKEETFWEIRSCYSLPEWSDHVLQHFFLSRHRPSSVFLFLYLKHV